MTDGDERILVYDYTHAEPSYVEDQRKLVNKFNLLKQEISLHKSELSNLKNNVSINCSLKNEVIRVNLENESMKDEIIDLKKVGVNWNIVKALGGKGKSKEKISSKEVIFTKGDESSYVLAPEITSDSESECDSQEPLPPLPKLIGAAPSGTLENTRPSVKVSHAHVIKKKTEKSPAVPKPCYDKKADSSTKQLLLTLMEEPKCSTCGSTDHLTKEHLEHAAIKKTLNAEEGDAFESLSGLRSMHDDDLASITGFETQDSTDHVSEKGTKTLHAFADKPAQSDPLGHLHEELCLLNNKVNQLESSITKHVSDSIQSTVPVIVTNTLKEQMPGLLSNALKDTLPQLIKDSIKSSVLESIAEELPQVEAQVQKNLQDQLPDLLLKPIYREFNAFNRLESRRFVLLQKELSKFLHTKMRKSIRLRVRTGMKEVRNKLSACTSTIATNSHHVQDLRLMFKDMVSLLHAAEGEQDSWATTVYIVQGGQPSAQVIPNAGQVPPVNEEKALVLHTLEEKSSEEDTSGKKETDDEPPAKKLKFLIPSS
ncbi:hypothetical protein Tco_1040109, partial [Tanacetum coccineum]